MTLLFSTGLVDSVMDSGWDTVFTNPKIDFRDGSVPSHPDDARTGNTLATVTLPTSSYFAAASGGIKTMNGSWAGSVFAGGTPTYFTIYDDGDAHGSSSSAIRLQGTCGAVASSSDIELDNLPLVALDTLDIQTFAFTFGQGVIEVVGGGTLA